jgi:hypothetical protein
MKDGKGITKIKTIGGIVHHVVGKGNLLIPFGKNNEINEEFLMCLVQIPTCCMSKFLLTKGWECSLILKMSFYWILSS